MFTHQSLLPLTLIFLSYSPASLAAPAAAASVPSNLSTDLAEPSGVFPTSTGPGVSSSNDAAVTDYAADLAVSADPSQTSSDAWVITTEALFTITPPTATPSAPSDSSATTAAALNVSPSLNPANPDNPDTTATEDVDVLATPSSTLVDELAASTTMADGPTTLVVLPTATPVAQDAVSSSSLPVPTVSSVPHLSVHVTPSAVVTNPNPTSDARDASTASQHARRSALVAACLTLAVLSALGACILCMRCGLLARLRTRRRTSRASELGGQPRSILREKHAPNLSTHDVATLPFLTRTPPLSCPSPPPRVAPVWAPFAPFAPFASHVSPIGAPAAAPDPRADSRASAGSHSGESYATCESRYSAPSAGRASGLLARSASLGSSAGSVPALELRRAPSPPSPPGRLRTPEMAHVRFAHTASVVRAPEDARGLRALSGLVGAEWDVAKAYGARGSAGADSVCAVNGEERSMDMDMETVDVGGRLCVLVQGY